MISECYYLERALKLENFDSFCYLTFDNEISLLAHALAEILPFKSPISLLMSQVPMIPTLLLTEMSPMETICTKASQNDWWGWT